MINTYITRYMIFNIEGRERPWDKLDKDISSTFLKISVLGRFVCLHIKTWGFYQHSQHCCCTRYSSTPSSVPWGQRPQTSPAWLWWLSGCSGSGPGASGSYPLGQPGDNQSQFPSGFHTVPGLVWQKYLLESIS